MHPTALVESADIGPGTRIWAFAHVMPDVRIGRDCNIGDNVFLESGVVLGDGVTVKNQVLLWKGVEVADYAFIGPNAVFTNDQYPRSPRLPLVKARYADEANWLVRTRVEEGAAIGAGAVILCGVTLGAYCLVAAGAVVIRSVDPFRIVAGNPARPVGWVDRGGRPLRRDGDAWINPDTGRRYRFENHQCREIKE